MIGRIPATKIAMLDGLNMDEMIEGYNDGRAGWPEPGDNRSYAYWHGWRNGAVDGGHRKGDAAQAALAADYVATLRKKKKSKRARVTNATLTA